MPVHKTKGGYKYGKTGKTYKNKKDAIRQAVAIAYSQARKKGRKPSKEEIQAHISGNPDNITKQANMKNSALSQVLYKQAASQYNQYGLLLKLAGGNIEYDDIYGKSRAERPQAGSYLAHRANLKRFGYDESGQWGVRGRKPEGLARLWPNWILPEEMRKYNIDMERGRVSKTRGDAIRLKTARRIADDFAAGNKDMADVLFDELMRRSEHNINTFRNKGSIRADYYREPNQEYISPNGQQAAANGGYQQQQQAAMSPLARRRLAHLQAMGINVAPQQSQQQAVGQDAARYTRKVDANTYKSQDERFKEVYRNLSREARQRYDDISAYV